MGGFHGHTFRVLGQPPVRVEGWYCPGCTICKMLDAMRTCHATTVVRCKIWRLVNISDDEILVWKGRDCVVKVSGHYVSGYAGAAAVVIYLAKALVKQEHPSKYFGNSGNERGVQAGVRPMR